MKSSNIEWPERAWAGMCALAPYLALLLLPGGSLLVLVLVVSRHGRIPSATLAARDRARSLTKMLFGKLPNNLYLGNHAPLLAFRSILGGRANEPNHRNGTHLAAESGDMGR
jgi:hypothetical protein